MSNFYLNASSSAILPPSVPTLFVADEGSATPVENTLHVITDYATQQDGATVKFVGAGNTLKLVVSDDQNNTFIGRSAGSLNLGASNTALGSGALNSINFAASNVAIGSASLSNMGGGFGNTCVGDAAGENLDESAYNTFLGYSAGSNYVGSESNNIIIGPTLGDPGDVNTIRIGSRGNFSSVSNAVFMYGIYNKTVDSTSARVILGDANALLGSIPNGTTNQVLTATTGGAPIWKNPNSTQVIWTTVTSADNPVNLVAGNGYIAKGAGVVNFVLPAAAVVGDMIYIVGYSNLWTIAQNAGQSIRISNATTAVGVTGSLSATLISDCVNLLCITANTEFKSLSPQGNLTVI